MGLLRSFGHLRDRLTGPRATREARADARRQCRFETMEPRQMLAADLHLGAVYYEPDLGLDNEPDVIEVSFEGGAAGAQLDRLVINGDKRGDGMTDADVFFDLANGGLGADQAIPLNIVASDGFRVTGVTVVDGGMQIIFDFEGFDAGEKFTFSLDADEANFINDDGTIDVSPIVEGSEFEHSQMSGYFSAAHYEDARLDGIFRDEYDPDFAAAAAAAGSTLNLPGDARFAANNVSNRTAGAVAHQAQVPLPIEISGTVYVDNDLDNAQDAGEPGLGDVNLALWKYDDATGRYVNTGKTAATDADGHYKFDNSDGDAILPGRYQVREAQPSGYFSVGATAGTVDGLTSGVVLDSDTIGHIDVLGGQESIDNDFAEAQPAEISGHVYHDRDNDGLRDAGEEGIAGAQIQIIAVDTINGSTGTITVTTDANGFWKATGLVPGKYKLVEAQPAGYFDGKDAAGTVNGVPVGAAVNPGDEIGEVQLLGNQQGVDYDFGELLPSSISGQVHADPEGDCKIGPNDVLLEGVRIDLYNEAGVKVATTLTDKDGRYKFDGLAPGTYTVFEHQPAGYFDSGDHVGTAGGQRDGNDRVSGILLVSDTHGTGYDFCELLPSSISGQVHADPEGDCEIGPNDILLEGVQIDLLNEAGDKIATTFTDKNGRYKFDGLGPGKYTVFEHQPAGYFDSGDHVGTAGGRRDGNDRVSGITLVSDTQAEGYDFCELLPSSISGQVHADPEGDCTIGPNDILLEGVQIDLYDETGAKIATTFTDKDGRYKFDGLGPGKYTVFEHQPAGYIDSGDHVGSAGGARTADDTIGGITLVSATNAAGYDFCEDVPLTLSGHVYHDRDNDGVRDAGEEGIAGVRLELLDADGDPTGVFVTTDAHGFYKFDGLAPGKWGVREVQPVGWIDGLDTPGNRGGAADNPGDEIRGANLDWAKSGEEYNFGELLPGSISGQVHADPEGDCTIGPDDVLLESVQVDLFNAAGIKIATTHTDKNGRYKFDGLAPGKYTVFEHQPAGYIDSGDHVGTAGGARIADDTIGGITLVSGLQAEGYDFCENVPVTLSGYVYHDRDNDGVRDAGEEGIAGVRLELLDANCDPTGVFVTTDSQGRYEFAGLAADTYGVREVQPVGWFDGLDTPGNRGGAAHNPGDKICEVTLDWKQSGTDYNFGELLPGSIAGRVIADRDGDCVVDPGERPIGGVVIELLDEDGNLLATTTTDQNGEYIFTSLRIGTYRVRERQPDDYFQGDQHVGSGGGAVLATDYLGQIAVGSDTHWVHYDFCEIPPAVLSGYVFQDGDAMETEDGLPPSDLASRRDGRRTGDDTPLAGVTLELRDGVTGQPISSSVALPGAYGGGAIRVVTDANGYYEFVGLPPGVYAVFEVQPGGYFDGLDTPGTTGGVAFNPGASIDPLVPAQLTADPANDAIARIHLGAGQVSAENNFSEVLARKEPFFFVIPQPPAPAPPYVPPTYYAAPQVPYAPLAQPPIYETLRWAGRGSMVSGYTWHLSVVDGGHPRAIDRRDVLVRLTGTQFQFNVRGWQGQELDRATWSWRSDDGVEHDRVVFGHPHATPVSGDFNGDGVADVGVFIKGEWFIDINGNGRWDKGDLWAKLGHDGDQPVVGDWDGDGKADIGIFGPAWPGDPKAVSKEPGLPDPSNQLTMRAKNLPPKPEDAALGARTMKLTSQGKLRADLIDHVFHYGTAGDRAVVGDWNGDGIQSIAVFRHGQWHMDIDGDGRWTDADKFAHFGQVGDLPVVGDWDGDGLDDIGVYRAGRWRLDMNHDRQLDAHDKVFELGQEGDLPIVADFNGDGIDQPGIYQPKQAAPHTARK